MLKVGLFVVKSAWALVLGTMMVLGAGAAIEVETTQLRAAEEKPLFQPHLLRALDGVFLAAQGEGTPSPHIPNIGSASVHFGTLNVEAMEMEWFRSEVVLYPIPPRGDMPWSMIFNERQGALSVFYAQDYGWKYIEAKHSCKDSRVIPVKSVADRSKSSFMLRGVDIAFLSSTEMVAVMGDHHGKVWFSRKLDGEPWGKWEIFGKGWRPQLSGTGGDLSVFWLQTDDKSRVYYKIENAPNLHLLKAPIRKGKVVLDEATRIATMPCAQIEVCEMDGGGRCLMYESGNSLYAMVGDKDGGSWTLPQKIVLSKDIGAIKSLSAISWKDDVCFVVGTESGEIHMGKIPQETLSAIPFHHGERPPVEELGVTKKAPVVSSHQQELKEKKERAQSFITLLGQGGSESEIQNAISFLKECPRMMADDIALLAFYDIQQNLQGMRREEWTPSVVSNCCECIRYLKHVGLERGTKKEWDDYPELLETVVAFHGGDNILPIVARSSMLIELKKYVDRAKRENSGDVQDVEAFIKKEAKAILKAWPEPEVKNMIKGLAGEEVVPSS